MTALWYNNSYTISMKTAISITDDLFMAADELARKIGISRSELYRRAVSAFVGRFKEKEVTAELDRVYGPQCKPAGLDKTLSSMQSASVEEEKW